MFEYLLLGGLLEERTLFPIEGMILLLFLFFVCLPTKNGKNKPKEKKGREERKKKKPF